LNVLLSLVMTVGTLEVVATGDTHTTYYASTADVLIGAYNIDAKLNIVGSQSATTGIYLGREIDPDKGYAHNFVTDTLSYQPDLVLLMLGTTDSQNWDSNTFTDDYQQIVASYPDTIATTLIPILPNNPQLEAANNIIQNEINPLIRGIPGYFEIGQPQLGWYGPDGILLSETNGLGYIWMADRMVRAIVQHYPGDHDFNGVDGGDYTVWADHFHKGSGHRNGDYNLDGYISGADYTKWADNMPRKSGAVVVPEMSGVVILSIGILALFVFKVIHYFLCKSFK